MHKAHVRETLENSSSKVYVLLINPSVDLIHLVRMYKQSQAVVYSLKYVATKHWTDAVELAYKALLQLQFRHLDLRSIQGIGPLEGNRGNSFFVLLHLG